MKETMESVRRAPGRVRRALAALPETSAARQGLACLGTMAAGVLLAGCAAAGQPMPFAVCLVAAAGTPLRALAAMLGCLLGYPLFWGLQGGLEPAAAAVLVFAAVCIVGGAAMQAGDWLLPAMTAAMAGLVGLLFLVQARFTPGAVALYAVRLAAAAAGTRLLCRAAAVRSPGALLAALCLLLNGAAAVELAAGVTLGQVAAIAAAAAAAGTGSGLLLAAACGLAVDVAAVPPASLTALLCAGALAVRCLPFRLRAAQLVSFLTTVVAGVLFTAGVMPELVPAAALGCCLAAAIPPAWFLDTGERAAAAAARQLEAAAAVFQELGNVLESEARVPPSDTAVIFDRASDRVCGSCVLWSQCWQQRSTETYHALCAAARPMLERGAAVREDFPRSFTDKCCRLDAFLSAVNRELDGLACRRQCDHRLREGRTVLRRQYAFLRDYLLQTAGRTAGQEPAAPARYRPELGIAMAGREGHRLSGDRGACFRTPAGLYCLLLCDGMGSGPEAAEESAAAIRTVAGLIRAGVEPRAALETLNGAYILRGDGGFSTVDLLTVSLATGEGILYKWGAAPSYLLHGGRIERIGTADPPPGLGVGETHKAAEYRLSLGEESLLVLLSDGAGGEDAGRRISALAGESPKALAAALVAEAPEAGEDDRTALALCLRPCSIRG